MEIFSTYGAVSWLVLFVAFLLIEIFTLGLTTIWFAGGSLVAFFVAVCGGNLLAQVIVFLVVSCVLLFFTRPIAMKYFNRGRTKTNAESLVGQQAVVKEEICNLEARGQVTVNGMEWTARSQSDERIPAGAAVEILEIQGVKLIVKKVEEEE